MLKNLKKLFRIVYHQNLHLAYSFALTRRFHLTENVDGGSSGEPDMGVTKLRKGAKMTTKRSEKEPNLT